MVRKNLIIISGILLLFIGLFFIFNNAKNKKYTRKRSSMANIVLSKKDYSQAIDILLSSSSLSDEDRDILIGSLTRELPKLPDNKIEKIFKESLKKYPASANLINSGWAWVLLEKGYCSRALEKISRVRESSNPFIKDIRKKINSKCKE